MSSAWLEMQLGEVCSLQRGFDLPKKDRDAGSVPLISASGRIDSHAVPKVAGPGVVTGRSGSIGRVFYIENNFWPLNTTLYVKDFHGNYPKFVYYLLSSFNLERFASGAGVPTLNRNRVHEEPVRIPVDVQEQKRIVAILDEAFAGIEAAIANTEKNLANAQELFLGFLNRAFDVKRHGWKESAVGDFAEHCLGKMLDKRKNRGVLRPYLRNVNVRWFGVDTSDLLEMKIEDAEADRYMVQRGDLLICEGGYPGRAAIWESDETVFFQKAVHRVRCHEPAHSRWLMYFLYLADATGYLRSYFTGAGIQHFTGKSLKHFMVPLAPADQAIKLTAKMDELRADLGRIESKQKRKLAALRELKQSLLKKAFSGELTAESTEREVDSATA